MFNIITEAVNSVKNFVNFEQRKIDETLKELENNIAQTEVSVGNAIKEIAVAEPDRKQNLSDSKKPPEKKKRYTFSTTFELPEEIRTRELEYILQNLSLYTQDGHISSHEIERILYHGDALEDNGVYLIVNEAMGMIAIPGQFMASGLSFAREVA